MGVRETDRDRVKERDRQTDRQRESELCHIQSLTSLERDKQPTAAYCKIVVSMRFAIHTTGQV